MTLFADYMPPPWWFFPALALRVFWPVAVFGVVVGVAYFVRWLDWRDE